MLNSLLKYKYKYSTKDLSTSTSTEERTDVQVLMYLAVCLLTVNVNYQPGTSTCTVPLKRKITAACMWISSRVRVNFESIVCASMRARVREWECVQARTHVHTPACI